MVSIPLILFIFSYLSLGSLRPYNLGFEDFEGSNHKYDNNFVRMYRFHEGSTQNSETALFPREKIKEDQ